MGSRPKSGLLQHSVTGPKGVLKCSLYIHPWLVCSYIIYFAYMISYVIPQGFIARNPRGKFDKSLKAAKWLIINMINVNS